MNADTVTIPRAEYERLVEAAEDLEDIQAFDRITRELDAGRMPAYPAALVRRILDGESRLLAFREWRGLSQAELARRSSVNRVQIVDIEAGRGQGSAATLRRLASALGVTVDELIPEEPA